MEKVMMKQEIIDSIRTATSFLENLGFKYTLEDVRAESFYIQKIVYTRAPISIELDFTEFVDCKSITLFVNHSSLKAGFNFDEYLKLRAEIK